MKLSDLVDFAVQLFYRTCYVTVDVGDTNWRVTVFRSRKNIVPLAYKEGKLVRNGRRSGEAFEQDMRNIRDVILEVTRPYGRVVGIAFAVAGRLNADRSALEFAGNLTHWIGKPIKAKLEAWFRCHVVLGNDAEAAALADAVYGHAARDSELRGKAFLGVGIGSGVGGACVRFRTRLELLPVGWRSFWSRVPLIGRWLNELVYETIPGEPGHIRVAGEAERAPKVCGCDQYDCVELKVGGSNANDRFGHDMDQLSDDDYIDEVLPWFIKGLESYLLVQPVKLVIMHGGAVCKRDYLIDEIQQQLHFDGFDVDVLLSYFGESAGAVGALSLFALDT